MNPGLIIEPRRKFPLLTLAGAEEASELVLPSYLDARSKLLTSSNQGDYPHCAGYGVAGYGEFWNWKWNKVRKQLDAVAIYDGAKKADGYPNEPGTTLRAAYDSAVALGFIPAGVDEPREVANSYEVHLALHRYDVALAAFEATDNWYTAGDNGFIKPGGKPVGPHCVLLCVRDTTCITFQHNIWGFQNSWGEKDGWNGFNCIDDDTFNELFSYALVWHAVPPAVAL